MYEKRPIYIYEPPAASRSVSKRNLHIFKMSCQGQLNLREKGPIKETYK